MRISVSNWQTTEADVEISVAAIQGAGRGASGDEGELTRSVDDLADTTSLVPVSAQQRARVRRRRVTQPRRPSRCRG